jgi:hypothetical protein
MFEAGRSRCCARRVMRVTGTACRGVMLAGLLAWRTTGPLTPQAGGGRSQGLFAAAAEASADSVRLCGTATTRLNVGVDRHAVALRREAYAHQHASRRLHYSLSSRKANLYGDAFSHSPRTARSIREKHGCAAGRESCYERHRLLGARLRSPRCIGWPVMGEGRAQGLFAAVAEASEAQPHFAAPPLVRYKCSARDVPGERPSPVAGQLGEVVRCETPCLD